MIKITRSYPAPESLEKEKAKKSGKYNKDDVVKRLEKDFYSKCYLCESLTTSSQVEHLKSHRGDLDLKFDWENLFLSCSHCNNIKLHNYDDILDCTKENVEEKIRYKMDPFPKADVYVYCVDEDKNTIDKTNKTVELLDKCYNGTTPLKNIDSNNIKEQILEEIKKFQEYIESYFESLDLDYLDDIKHFERKIKYGLSKKSKYTSFKRWIIKDNKNLDKVFGKYIDD